MSVKQFNCYTFINAGVLVHKNGHCFIQVGIRKGKVRGLAVKLAQLCGNLKLIEQRIDLQFSWNMRAVFGSFVWLKRIQHAFIIQVIF